MPGVELGVLLMCVFGKEGIVFVYLATIAGFGYGRDSLADAVEQLEKWSYPQALQENLKGEIRSQIEQLRFTFG